MATDTNTLPLRSGASGEAVRDLQRRLARVGHDTAGDRPGAYGPGTEGAVRAFQEHRGLRVDGVCGPQTWASLVEADHALGDRLLYLRAPMLRGDDVAELQRLLGALGFDAGRVDGILGARTAAATAEFQRNAGLTTDGICGPATIEGLRRYRRADVDDLGSTVATLREVEVLRTGSRRIAGLRVMIAEDGGTGALADAVSRALADLGAVTTVVRDPDETGRAEAANAFGAGLFVALAVREPPGITCAYYGRDGFESVGGRRLAELVSDALDGDAPRGMRLPVLRETKMPAVVVEVGPPSFAVAGAPGLVRGLAAAVERWVEHPIDPLEG